MTETYDITINFTYKKHINAIGGKSHIAIFADESVGKLGCLITDFLLDKDAWYLTIAKNSYEHSTKRVE